MAKSLDKNEDLIFVVFLGLLVWETVACPGVGPHPLPQESIVPERDLPPRNFNPHPYVSAVDVLSNFDHPYAGVASKRSGYFRNDLNTGVRQLDNDLGKTSINSLANFARRFLRLNVGYNEKNKEVIDNDGFTRTAKFFYNINNYPLVKEDRALAGYRIIDNPRSRNGQKNSNSDDIYGDRNWERITQLSSTLEDERGKLYLGKTLNLASDVQQSSLNEDALSPRDTNDNLSQGPCNVSWVTPLAYNPNFGQGRCNVCADVRTSKFQICLSFFFFLLLFTYFSPASFYKLCQIV